MRYNLWAQQLRFDRQLPITEADPSELFGLQLLEGDVCRRPMRRKATNKRHDGDRDLSIIGHCHCSKTLYKVAIACWDFYNADELNEKETCSRRLYPLGKSIISKDQINRIVAMTVVSVKSTASERTKQRSCLKFNHWSLHCITLERRLHNKDGKRKRTQWAFCCFDVKPGDSRRLKKAIETNPRERREGTVPPGRLNEVRNGAREACRFIDE